MNKKFVRMASYFNHCALRVREIFTLTVPLSIKLHYFVFYSPRDGHRIADKFNNARDYLSAILWPSLGL